MASKLQGGHTKIFQNHYNYEPATHKRIQSEDYPAIGWFVEAGHSLKWDT